MRKVQYGHSSFFKAHTTIKLIILISIISAFTKGQIIEEYPLSLAIPANQIGSFSCKAICIPSACIGYWIIDNYHSQDSDVSMWLESRGFQINPAQQTNQTTHEYTLTLRVNASLDVNNSQIVCEFVLTGDGRSHNRSNTGTLIVLADVPLSSNPAIDRNTTHFILQWSPPFLWPGKRTEYYIITLYDSYNTSGSTHYRVNTTSVISVLETFAVNVSSTMNGNLQCTAVDFTFSVAAVALVSESTLPAFNANITIAPTAPSLVQLPSSAANVSVLFKGDSTPGWLLVYIQLPRMCGYKEEKNYTMTVESREGATVSSHIGHSSRLTTETLRTVFSLDLKRNHTYMLRVVVKTDLQTASSEKIYFNTSYQSLQISSGSSSMEVQTYQLVMGVALSIALLLITAMAVVIVCLCVLYIRALKESRFRELRAIGVRNNMHMVDNPIYVDEGPVYDCVKTQQTRQQEAEESDSTDQHYENLHRRSTMNEYSLPERDISIGCNIPGQQQHLTIMSLKTGTAMATTSSDDESYTVMMPASPAHC